MTDWDHTTDFLIIGSGSGGLCASIAARDAGADALILEKQATIGGNTGLSGGTLYIPNNPLMREEGIEDSTEAALAYMDALVGDVGPASSPERRAAYLSQGLRLFGIDGHDDCIGAALPNLV